LHYNPALTLSSNFRSYLTNVIIPDSVTSIGDSAFYNCTSLTSVTIPSSVTSIGDSAFGSCTSLTSVTIPSSVTSIGNFAFQGCTSLTSVTIPDSVTIIRVSTCYNCTSLTSVIIPNSVTSIGSFAFSGTSLTTVFYVGTNTAAWEAITIDSDNNSNLTSATRYYYSVTNPGTSGTHWRFVDGIPTIWN
jgi:hypothetical protein